MKINLKCIPFHFRSPLCLLLQAVSYLEFCLLLPWAKLNHWPPGGKGQSLFNDSARFLSILHCGHSPKPWSFSMCNLQIPKHIHDALQGKWFKRQGPYPRRLNSKSHKNHFEFFLVLKQQERRSVWGKLTGGSKFYEMSKGNEKNKTCLMNKLNAVFSN